MSAKTTPMKIAAAPRLLPAAARHALVTAVGVCVWALLLAALLF